MLGPYAYIKIRTQLGGERIITVDEITQAIGWARNTVQRAVDDLIVEGLVRRSPGPGGRLRRLYAVDPETLPSILPLDGPDLADPDPDPDPEPLNYNPDSLLEDL